MQRFISLPSLPEDFPAGGGRPPRWRAFVIGLFRPSGLALTVAGLVCLSWMLASLVLMRPSYLARQTTCLLCAGNADGDGAVTQGLLRISNVKPGGPPLLALVGSSSLRRSVRVALLESRLGGPAEVAVVSATLGKPLMIDQLAIIAALPSRPMAVVLELSAGSLGEGAADVVARTTNPRVGVRSDVVDSAIRARGAEPAPRRSHFLLDNSRFLLPRMPWIWANFAFGGPVLDNAATGLWETKPPAASSHRRVVRPFRPRAEAKDGLPTNFEIGLEHLKRAVGLARARGASVVLLEAVRRSDCRAGSPEIASIYQVAVENFASRERLPYLNLSHQVGLQSEDFADCWHLSNAAAVDRYTTALAREIAVP